VSREQCVDRLKQPGIAAASLVHKMRVTSLMAPILSRERISRIQHISSAVYLHFL
jgi:hypothetical protein